MGARSAAAVQMDPSDRTTSSEKGSGEEGSVGRLRNPIWLITKLAELLEQNQEHKDLKQQPKQIAANEFWAAATRVKQDTIEGFGDRRNSA